MNTIRKVAVLGAGVMGAQIAAHLVNARVPVILFDLSIPKDKGPSAGIAQKAIAGLAKMNPEPLALATLASHIEAADYDNNIESLRDCSLIIEAIAERMDWKHSLYRKIAPFIAKDAILASNTSGLPIKDLAEVLSDDLKKRFCGVHFFNPPRYMHLVELVAIPTTSNTILDQLESFLTTTLGKGVIRAKDTPNFIANRVGTAGMSFVMEHARQYGLSFEVVDEITGSRIGRAKSATFRTADVVGLDTMAHVINTMKNTLSDDPWHRYFVVPSWLQSLLDKGLLGQKTKAGIFKKQGKEILMYSGGQGDYVPATGKIAPEVEKILRKKSWAERLPLLRESTHPQAQFLWAVCRDTFHYCAVHLDSIAHHARDVDFAMRWGYGHQMGPFEVWQEAGWRQVGEWIAEDIVAGKTLSNVPLPAWVSEGLVPERGGVHTPGGSWSGLTQSFIPRSEHPVYRRQKSPAQVSGAGDLHTLGTTVDEDQGSRLWTTGDNVLILSFKSKLGVLGPQQVAALHRAVECAEEKYAGLVIYSPSAPAGGAFSAGADLQAMQPLIEQHGIEIVAPEIKKLQEAFMRVKYAQVPVVAAVAGLALGGGNELQMHTARRVLALESYIGLVEVGVGLIPAGGGLKEAALRASEGAQRVGSVNWLEFLRQSFETIATAQVSKSALQAIKLGFVQESDMVVMNLYELLHVACVQVRAMADAGYRPPLKRLFPVAGRTGIATIKAQLVNMREGGFISAYDMILGERIAYAMCGGEVDPGTMVDEEWILRLEAEGFMASLRDERTQERIYTMLSTGKPLRN